MFSIDKAHRNHFEPMSVIIATATYKGASVVFTSYDIIAMRLSDAIAFS